MAVPFVMQKAPEPSCSGAYEMVLQGELAGEGGHAGRIPLTVELITHGKNDNTHQSCQQNPRHIPFLPTRSVCIMQETLQIHSVNSYYTHFQSENKMTMQEFMKKCFYPVLAKSCAKGCERGGTCSLRGRGLQSDQADGRCGWQLMPWVIKQVGAGTVPKQSESAESYDSALKHLRGDSNPCFSLERAAC